MALFAPPTTTWCRGEGSSRKRAAAPARFEDCGWAPGAPGRWRPSGRAGHLSSLCDREHAWRPAFEAGPRDERPEASAGDRRYRDDALAGDDRDRAAACPSADLDERAGQV